MLVVACLISFLCRSRTTFLVIWDHTLFICVNAVKQCMSGKHVDRSIHVSLTTKEFWLHNGSNPEILLSQAFCPITAKLVTPYPSMILVFFLPVSLVFSFSYEKTFSLRKSNLLSNLIQVPSLFPYFNLLGYASGFCFVIQYSSSLTII